MKRKEFDVFGEATNAVVLRSEGRRYPGVLIQGDSLHGLVQGCAKISEALEDGLTAKAAAEADDFRERLVTPVRAHDTPLLHLASAASCNEGDMDRDPNKRKRENDSEANSCGLSSIGDRTDATTMFRIRKRNWDAFREHVLGDFEKRMLTHLRKFYPAECARLGEERIVSVIRYGTVRARSHGLTSERATCIYIDVMFAFGRDFDVDSTLPWASHALRRREFGSPKTRAAFLFSCAYEHRDEARGLSMDEVLP